MCKFNLQLDYYEILNLHKALLEAKFHLNSDNELVSGSPLVADIYVQVRELLINSNKSTQWLEWFQLKNRPDYRKRAILLMKTCKHWSGASFNEKQKIAQNFLSPFFYDETELKEAINEADKNY